MDPEATPSAPRPPPDRRPHGPLPTRGVVGKYSDYARLWHDPLGFVAGRIQRFGDIYCVPNPGAPLYVLRHPDHLRELLVDRASAFTKGHSAVRALSRVLGDGLLTSDGETWQRQRRIVQPAFTKARLAQYAEVMREEAVEAMTPYRDGSRRDVGADMMHLTLRIVARTLFGRDLSRDGGRDATRGIGGEAHQIGEAMRIFQESLGRPSLVPAWARPKGRSPIRVAVESLDAIIYGLIAERVAETAKGLRRDDLLQSLIDATDPDATDPEKGRLTPLEVRDQLVTMFLAGHETTAQALTWTFYLLARNPAVEARLHRELDEHMRGAAPTNEELPRLRYTEQVLKEAMRLYPPAYTVARAAGEDTELGGYPVPRGSEVVAWIYMTHRDPRWFPDPLAFRPERFAPEAEAALPRYAYLPFGGGPRACIGRAFAMTEAQIVLATLARGFRFVSRSTASVGVKPRITLVPARPVKMTVQRRRA